MSGLGTYVMDSKARVNRAGTDSTTGGSSNPDENFTPTGDFDYSTFGLAPGTVSSGIRMTSILEDTRGINNGNTNFSSSLIDFTFAGEIIPEPSSTSLLILGGITGLLHRRR